MRISVTAITLIGCTIFTAAAFADPPQNQARKTQPQEQEQLVFVTGSLIPQRIKLHAIATKTVSPIRIIDRHEIDSTGRFNTPSVIINEPAARIVGH